MLNFSRRGLKPRYGTIANTWTRDPSKLGMLQTAPKNNLLQHGQQGKEMRILMLNKKWCNFHANYVVCRLLAAGWKPITTCT